MANDIIARLRLNGQQFSQDTKSVFSAFNTDAQASASAAKSAFQSNFDQIQQIARNALTMPRTDTGSLDVGVKSYQDAAAAANAQAIALREVATAAALAAKANGDTSAETRLYVAAAEAAAIEGEQNAASATTQAAAMEKLQQELNRTKTAVLQEAAANDTLSERTGGATAAKLVFQHVLRSTTDSFAAGLPVSMIFGEQIDRLGEAFELAAMQSGATGGAMGTFASILTGPVGIALTTAVAVAGPFIAKLLDGKSAADDVSASLDKAASSADAFGNAESLLGKIIDLQTGKLKTHNQVLIQTIQLQAQANLQAAQKTIDDAKPAKPISGYGSSQAASGGGIGGQGSIDAAAAASQIEQAQQKAFDAIKAALVHTLSDDTLANSDPSAYAQQVGGALKLADGQLDKIARSGKVAGQSLTDAKLALIALASAGEQKAAALESIGVIAGGPVPDDLKPYKSPKKVRQKKAPDTSGLVNSVTNDIANFTGQFTEAPTYIEKADAALRKLQADSDKLNSKQAFINPETFAKLQTGIASTKQVILDNLDKPFQDFMRLQEESYQTTQLQIDGQGDQAAAFAKIITLQKQQGALDDDHLDAVVESVTRLREQADAYQLIQQRQTILLQGLDSYKSDLEGVFDGAEKLKDLPSKLVVDFRTVSGKILFNDLFGSAFQDLKNEITGAGGVSGVTQQLKDAIAAVTPTTSTFKTDLDNAGSAAIDFATALTNAKNIVSGTGSLNYGSKAADGSILDSAGDIIGNPNTLPGGSSGASDTGSYFDAASNEIVVNAARKMSDAGDKQLSAVGLFDKAGAKLNDSLGKLGIHLPDQIANKLGSVLEGASYGGIAGSVFSSITGGKGSKTGSAIGGALGDVAGKELGKVFSKSLGSLGQYAGPLGAIAGGILGSVIGGLFKSVPHGASTITGSNGNLSASAGFGNNAKAESAAVGEAGTVIQGIQQVAQQLGAIITGSPNITVGTYKGKYRVNTQGTKLGGSSSPVPGLTDFGDDEQAAVEYAVEQSISKGVITGISQASINILKSGQDLQTAITKATAIESIPKTLKGLLDPVGEAIDELNEQFNTYVADLKEGGATTEQMAQAQQLYNLQLQQIKASTDSASQTLKDFLQSLKVASDSPLSLRDQESSAKAALQPFLDSINAGQAIDQSKYQDAAQAFLDIERQLYGSTDAYFQQFDAIQAATSKAISTIDNATPIASPANASDPFASQTADATQKTATATQTSAELLSQVSQQLAAQNDLLTKLTSSSPSTGSFASGDVPRLFVKAS